MSAQLSALWGRPTQAKVRVQLPAGMGPGISIGGTNYEAVDGFVTVPPEAAIELRAHLPTAPDPVGGSGAALREEIRVIDDRLAEVRGELAKLNAALRRAEELKPASGGSTAAAVQELASIATKRRNTITAWLLGSVKRTALDEVEAQHSAAAAKAAAGLAQDQKANEIAALGVAEIRERMNSTSLEELNLKSQRDLALRRAIRVQAESAAAAYWVAAGELGRRLAYLNAHALLLAEMERGTARENIPGGAQSFGVPYVVPRIDGLPTFPELAFFQRQGVRSHQASCPFDQAEARERLRQDLIAQGLMA